MQVVVDSLLTNYHYLGQDNDKTIMILHGWADNSANWLNFGTELARDYRVLIVDLPGFGRTDMPPQPWGLDEYAGFVASFVRKIDQRPHYIIGHSNGGAIAIRGLANATLQADRLVLLASAGVRTTHTARKNALRLIAKTGKTLTAPLPHSVQDTLRRRLYTSAGSDMLVAEHLQETFKRVVGDDVQQDAARLDLPVLLVYGEDDKSTPPEYGRLLHERLAASTLDIIGQAGHFAHNDQPARVLALVREFLG